MARILVIDDKPDNLTVVCAMLGHSIPGCTVITAQSGEEGIIKAGSEAPDTILLDVKMPGMDGFEVCKRLKADPRTQYIPVIMFTAVMKSTESQVLGFESGADAYLTKPVEPPLLAAQVKIALRIKTAEDRLRKENIRLSETVEQKTGVLEESQTRFQALVAHSKDHVFMIDEKGKYLWSNDRIEAFGLKKGQSLTGMYVHDVYPPDVAEIYRNKLAEVLESGRSVVFEHDLKRSGDAVYHIDTLYPVFHKDRIQAVGGICHDVTDKKTTEIRVAETRKGIANLMGNLPGMAYRCRNDKNWTLDFASEGCLELTGYPPEDLLFNRKVSYSDLIHPQDRKMVWQSVQKAVTAKERFELTYRLIARNGTIKWVWEKGIGSFSDDGRLLFLEGLILDISEQKQSQQALKESEKRFRLLYENIPQPYQSLDENGRFVEANNAWLKHFGYTREEVIGRSFAEFLHPDWTEHFKTNFPVFKSTGEILGIEFEMKKKDGSSVTVAIDGNIGYDRDGSFKQTHCVLTDISQRRRSEEALRSAHQLLLAVLNGIDSHVLVADMNTYEILFMNKSMQQTFGGDFRGQQCWKALRNGTGPCGHCRNLNLLDKEGRPSAGIVWEDKNPVTGKWFLNSDRAIQWIDGRLVKLQVATDITEKKEMESHRNELEKKLIQAQKMEAIGTLAGGIAHDFNNILSSVIGYAELAMECVEKESLLMGYLREVDAAGIRAKDLVKQILTFARQSDEEIKPVQVAAIAKEALKFIRSSIPSTIELRQNMDSLSLVSGNPTQIHQVFMNLCTNAAYAMEDSGGVLDVAIKDVEIGNGSFTALSGLKSGNYLKITVSDTGAGIPQEIIHSIFNPFFTTKGPGEGTGMGLAVVHGIVRKYGGDIFVESESGKGTIFTIYLPVTKTHTDYQRQDAQALPCGYERILVVDDELFIVDINRQILEGLGYTVTTRTSSVEALALFRSKPDAFDLVITDMTMPKMTGDKLALEMISIRPDIPVILCTGYSRRISEESIEDIGIKAFAYKPIIRADLAKTVRKVLNEAKGRT